MSLILISYPQCIGCRASHIGLPEPHEDGRALSPLWPTHSPCLPSTCLACLFAPDQSYRFRELRCLCANDPYLFQQCCRPGLSLEDLNQVSSLPWRVFTELHATGWSWGDGSCLEIKGNRPCLSCLDHQRLRSSLCHEKPYPHL